MRNYAGTRGPSPAPARFFADCIRGFSGLNRDFCLHQPRSATWRFADIATYACLAGEIWYSFEPERGRIPVLAPLVTP